MPKPDSKDYFERRAEQERTAAERCADERAAQSHRELADHYRQIAEGAERLPASDPKPNEPGILPKDFRILP